jgi:hypothetical protein
MSHHADAQNAANDDDSLDSAAQGAAASAANDPRDDDLAKIVRAWPALPEAIKTGILAMIGAAK